MSGACPAVAVVDAALPFETFDFSTAERWYVLVLAHGVPVARVEMPSPGRVESGALAAALFAPHADRELRFAELRDTFLRRLGAPPAPPPPVAVTVAVCTHRRPEYIARALEALTHLDPAPAEIIVVDNDPGDLDCRAQVEAIGARYVREDRRGLDNARNTAIAAARGDVVAFTDDDCVPPPGWLRYVPEAFADANVGAVSGPAFPLVLDTPARVRMERQASLTRGLHRRAADWTTLSTAHAGQMGAGANLLLRRSALDPRPFPPELDAGTPTGSGGDTYLLARLLATGRRIAYDPRIFVFHQHRPERRALHDAFLGYGTGVTALMTKLLVEDGELEAAGALRWLLSQYRETQWRRLRGRADAVETRLAWNYLRGAVHGPGAWMRSRAQQRRLDGCSKGPGPLEHPRPAPEVSRGPGPLETLSVVVPTVRRPDALGRCLDALAAQTVAPLEVIVVDDADPPTAAPGDRPPLEIRVLTTRAAGAAGARNAGARAARGDVLLFLDDDLIPAPAVVARHLAAHAAGDGRYVVGPSRPRPADPTLAASGATLWWEDHNRALAAEISPTFTSYLSGNASVRRTDFLALGGFDERLGVFRREDWELGLRAAAEGLELVFDAEAVCDHAFALTAAGRRRAARNEGRGDALLLARHPHAWANLPVRDAAWPRPWRPRTFVRARVLGAERTQPAIERVLAVLERRHLRRRWVALQNDAQHAAYGAGLRAGGYRPRRLRRGHVPVQRIELDSTAPIPAPGAVTPDVQLVRGTRDVARIRPSEGHWGPAVAEQLAAAAVWRGGPALAPPPPSVPAVPRPLAIEVLDGSGTWAAIARRLAAARADVVVVPFPGVRITPRLLDDLQVAFAAPRVAVALGERPWENERRPLVLHEDHPGRLPFARIGSGCDYIAFRTAALAQTGGPEPALEPLGPQAQALWCADRALRAGHLVAGCDSLGLERRRAPAGAARSAFAAMLACHGRTLGPAQRTGALLAAALRGGGGMAAAALRRDHRALRRQVVLGAQVGRGLLRARRLDAADVRRLFAQPPRDQPMGGSSAPLPPEPPSTRSP